MDQKFAQFVEQLQPSFERLLACAPVVGPVRLPLTTPLRGVYLFTEQGKHLYVGRTNRLRDRHREHWKGRHNDAPFAFKLARHATSNVLAKGGLTRAALEADAVFSSAFSDAKARVAEMEFRWVEERDPLAQCLLEIYAAVVLEAPFNDFENH